MGSTHQGPELPFFVVVHKKLFRQYGLIVEHVDQKAQSTQVITQLIEYACCAGLLLIHLGDQHLLDTVTHAQYRLRSLFKTQYRQNATHLRQLAGNIPQNSLIQRISKKQIQ